MTSFFGKSRSLVLASVFGWSVGVAGPLPGQERREYTEVHMGVPVRMVLYEADEARARDAAAAAFDRIALLDDKLSDYRPESELRRLERRPGEWVPVSPELARVLQRAVEVARATDGAFDPTVGPLVRLWREARRTGRLPTPAALDSARALTGWRKLRVDRVRGAARLDVPGMRLDLGGVAKGYVLQEALAVLRARGVRSALVEGGGDVIVGAPPPGRNGWEIEAPGADAAFRSLAASLVDRALATSGPGEQSAVIDGGRYSHVVDPRTGRALTSARSAMVIARDAAMADALATALTVLHDQAARRILGRLPPGVRASVIDPGSPPPGASARSGARGPGPSWP